MALFDSSWAAQRIAAEQAAVEAVRSLDRRAIADPALAGVLDKIANHHTPVIATLQPDRIVGKRWPIERVVSEFGESRRATFYVIDIIIPFQGDPISFRLSPSYCTLPSQRCDLQNDHLVVSLADDDNVQTNVDQFVQQITQNLNALRSEVASWGPNLRALLNQVADARMKEFAVQSDRDKGLKFKVE